MNEIKEYILYRDEERKPYLNIKSEFDYETSYFDNSYDIAHMMVDLYSMHELFTEYSYVIGFDCSGKILGIVELGHETDTQTPTPIKIMFISLLLMGANKFVLVHNHPNNIMEASVADINLGSKVTLGANLLGLEFWDQIIIGDEDFISMKKEKLM